MLVTLVSVLIMALAIVLGFWLEISNCRKIIADKEELIAKNEELIEWDDKTIGALENLISAHVEHKGVLEELIKFQDKVINSLREELSYAEESVNSQFEFRDFSNQTTLRATYLQMISNPTSALTMPEVINMIEATLEEQDNEWYTKAQSAFKMALSGDESGLRVLYKKCAQDLMLIQPSRYSELLH